MGKANKQKGGSNDLTRASEIDARNKKTDQRDSDSQGGISVKKKRINVKGAYALVGVGMCFATINIYYGWIYFITLGLTYFANSTLKGSD